MQDDSMLSAFIVRLEAHAAFICIAGGLVFVAYLINRFAPQERRHIRRVVIMLNDLDDNASNRPVRRTRIERIRRKVDAACRRRLAIELSAGLLTPAAEAASAGEAEIAALEATAHTLRRFCAIARQRRGKSAKAVLADRESTSRMDARPRSSARCMAAR